MEAVDFTQKYKFNVPSHLDPSKPILVVEGQQDMRLIVVHHLTKMQFSTIHQASNGLEAIEILKNHTDIHLVICSYDMEGMSGIEMLEEMREQEDLNRVPFCLTIANINKDKLMRGVEAGVDEVLVKPFTLGDINPKLKTAYKVFHNPKNPEKVYELAKVLIRKKEYDKADAVYQDLLSASQKAARPIVGMAKIARYKGDPEKALKLLAQAEQRNAKYVHIYAQRGEIYAEQKNWEKALHFFEKAIELSPLNPIRYEHVGKILMETKKYEELISIFKKALDKELSFPSLFSYLSQASFQLKDFKQASRFIKHALSKDPENLEYLNQLAIALKELKQFDDAGKTYNKIIKLDPDNIPALFNKAVMLEGKGNVDEAIKILERLKTKHPEFTRAQEKLDELKK